MGESGISDLMLERYNLDELSYDEKIRMEKLIERDPELQTRLSELKRSDFEFLNRYPARAVLNQDTKKIRKGPSIKIISGICAAMLFAGISFPLVWNRMNPPGDRAKGAAPVGPQIGTELSVFLKTGQESTVYEGLPLHEGSTIQLAYTVPGNRYGVIFSIDGRSQVTLHYPYSMEGTTQLISGKQTALDEAYMLDDAPEYEVFVFVVSTTPLSTRAIISNAESLAGDSLGTAQNIINKSKSVFSNYDVKTVYLKKE